MISIIVAKDKNGVIGKAGGIPWKHPADLAFFKKTTLGHPIIMGRKTFQSIGKVLLDRTNIVVTGDVHWSEFGTIRAGNVDEAISIAKNSPGSDEIFIIGGGNIYNQTIGLADRLYVTEIDTEVIWGDTFFPAIDPAFWSLIQREEHAADKKNQYRYSFVIYERNKDYGKQN
ncbi:MAG: dihydrofolate reductase [Candidatus Vogelbacteria bacterium]|nr:dihydrofolate reductase [Candidatus Vogelbacteria bacterium]